MAVRPTPVLPSTVWNYAELDVFTVWSVVANMAVPYVILAPWNVFHGTSDNAQCLNFYFKFPFCLWAFYIFFFFLLST